MKKTVILSLLALLSVLLLNGCNQSVPTTGQYVDAEQEIGILSFKTEGDDASVGDLYYHETGTEREKVSGNVKKDEYMFMPLSAAALYLDNENSLYRKEKGQEKEKVSENVLDASFLYSADETMLAFLTPSEDEALAELYLKSSEGEKEKVASDIAVGAGRSAFAFSADSKSLYFLSNDKKLYQKKADSEKTLLAENVSLFNVNPVSDSYTYLDTDEAYHIKWSNQDQPQLLRAEGIGNLRMSDSGLIAAYTANYNFDTHCGDLYVCIQGDNSIKIASDVTRFILSHDGRNLYYLNSDGVVYLKKLPAVNETTQENVDKFAQDVDKEQPLKMCGDVSEFDISESGLNSLFLDNEGNLYVSYQQKEKVKAASDVQSAKIFESSFYYLNVDGQLYRNSVLKNVEQVKENNKMIAQEVSGCTSSKYGKYIVFATADGNTVSVCEDGQKPESVVDNMDSYDAVIYQQQAIYEKKLTLADIAGMYKIEELEIAYKISDNGNMLIYFKGNEAENIQLTTVEKDKFTLGLKTDNPDSDLAKNEYWYIRKADGSNLLQIGETQYSLVVLDETGLNQEIEHQKAVEAEREAQRQEEERIKAEEARRKEEEERQRKEAEEQRKTAEEKGKKYLSEGAFIPTSQELYMNHDYSSGTNRYFTKATTHDVYDYYISDFYTVWVKVYTSGDSLGNNAGYRWVPMN